MDISLRFRFILISLTLLVSSRNTEASFHVMQVEQVIGAVDGDVTAQAVQLRMRAAGQSIVSAASVWVADATGANRVLLLDIPSNVANSAAGAHILLASANFLKHISPSTLSADFVLSGLIPTNYFKAGRLTYEQDGGSVSTPGFILWSLSWGGTNYTGPHTGDTVNDANGNFGPAFSGPLPTNGISALQFTNTAAALSTSNVVDYIATTGSVTFTKNNGTAGILFKPTITSIRRETNSIRVTWTTLPGKTNALQRAATVNGSFTDLFLLNNPTGSVTNFLDVGAVTNYPAGFYRVRNVP